MRTRSGCRIAPAAIVLVLALAPPAASVQAPPESTASKLLDALGVVRPSGPRSADSVTAPNDTRGDLPSTMVAGIVLREVRTSSSEPGADTLVTFLTPGRMRVTYGDMHTILDVTGDRFLLLETGTATYRSIPFSDWESEVRRSPDDTSEPDTLRFEAMSGEPVPIAGYPCSRYHLFSRREVFPGEFETVEQEIWVTRELALPPGALETWRRVQQALDWVGLGAPVVRPDAIALRTATRRRPEGATADADEFETVEAIAVEPRDVPVAWFEIPAGYARAEPEEFEPDEEPGGHPDPEGPPDAEPDAEPDTVPDTAPDTVPAPADTTRPR